MGWPQVIALAVSTVANHMAQKGKQDRQDALASQMNAYNMKKSDETTAAINQFLGKIDPAQREAALNEEQNKIRDNINAQIGASAAYAPPTGFAGKPNAEFAGRVDSNTAAAADRTKRIVQALSVIGAPGQRSLQQGRDLGLAAGEVDGANGAMNRVGNRFMAGINSQKPDAGWSLLGQIAQGAGMASSLGAFGAPAAVADVGGMTSTGLKAPVGASLGEFGTTASRGFKLPSMLTASR
jgi:competence protein ComGC